VPDNTSYRKLFGLEPNYYGKAVMTHIAPLNIAAYDHYVEELQLTGYSPNTIRTYSIEFVQLLKLLKDNPVEQMTAENLRSYILYCIRSLKLSENLIYSRLNALKFYIEQVLHYENFFMEIPRPKKPGTLPDALLVFEMKKCSGWLNTI